MRNEFKKRAEEQHHDPEKRLPLHSVLAFYPLICPCLAALSFLLLLIDINDVEQHDLTLFTHPMGSFPHWQHYSSLVRHSTHEPTSSGWHSVCVCHHFLRDVFPVACNKDNMWPPAFRTVEAINLPAHSNTSHLWPFTHAHSHVLCRYSCPEHNQPIKDRKKKHVNSRYNGEFRFRTRLSSISQHPSLHTSVFPSRNHISWSQLSIWILNPIFLSHLLMQICFSITHHLFSVCLIFIAAHSCLLAFSILINTTCQGITFHPRPHPPEPLSPFNTRYMPPTVRNTHHHHCHSHQPFSLGTVSKWWWAQDTWCIFTDMASINLHSLAILKSEMLNIFQINKKISNTFN